MVLKYLQGHQNQGMKVPFAVHCLTWSIIVLYSIQIYNRSLREKETKRERKRAEEKNPSEILSKAIGFCVRLPAWLK